MYKAYLERDGKHYAIKVVRKDLLVDYRREDLALIEKQLMSEVAKQHPNLISLDFMFQSELRLYYIMEYLPRGSLRDHLLN